MRKNKTEAAFTNKYRNIISEFVSVFFVIAANGTFMFLLLVRLIREFDDRYSIAILGLGNLLFTSIVSTALIYFVKSRVYSNKIKEICKVSNMVADGNFNVRISQNFEKPKSDMDYLVSNFNKMLVEISSLENMKNDFIADISHEIKTPLSNIQGYVELLQNPNINKKEKSEYIHILNKTVRDLSSLVDNVLKLNRIENQGIVTKESFSLDEQIRCAVLDFEEKFEEKSINLNVELEEIVINTDKAYLSLVWSNLISNAIKFTDFGGNVSIKLEKKGKRVIVTVKDDGCGMSPQTEKRIFEKFYQGESSHCVEGNGLGLALVKKILNLLNGHIRVKTKLNKGSEFEVVLYL